MDSTNNSANNSTATNENLNKNTRSNTNTNQTNSRFLTFTVRGKQYAMPLLKVLQVTALSTNPNSKTIPTTINHRGNEIKVIDLGQKIGNTKTQVSRETTLIALESNSNTCAIVVDSVDDVVNQNEMNNISILDTDKI